MAFNAIKSGYMYMFLWQEFGAVTATIPYKIAILSEKRQIKFNDNFSC